MFICIVPTAIILFFQMYPKDWKKRNLVLGVKNREEFRSGEVEETVDKIYAKYRGTALRITIAICIISCALLFLRGMTLMTTVWTSFIFVALFALTLPLLLGNKEMKDYKRRIGISGEENVTYVDLSNAGAIRTLKMPQVILPNLIGLLLCVFALLVDLKVITLGRGWNAGSFMGTGVTVLFFLMGILITALGFLMDGLRNEVISSDSDVNANYNRAKKKNMSKFMVLFLWTNAIYTVLSVAGFVFLYSEMLFMGCMALYLFFIMAGIALFTTRNGKIEERYAKEISIFEDDDDHWLGGVIYYNPKDKRLNVEKRVGVGGTVNLAHPVGKLIGVFGALSIIATVICLVWLGMMEATPMKLMVEDEKVICHQLRDEYVIRLDEIQDLEYGDLSKLRMSRVAGVGMDTILKGNFIVNDESGCRVFIWRETRNYIMIRTAEHTYYVNGSSTEDTLNVYQELQKSWPNSK